MSNNISPQSFNSPNASSASSSQGGDNSKNGRNLRRILFVIGTLSLIMGTSIYVSRKSKPQETEVGLTYTVTRGELLVTVTEQGALGSSNNTEIKCEVRGSSTVTSVVEGGSHVEPGDVLVQLDTKVIEEQVSLTRTNALIATATLERSLANFASAQIAIDAYKEGRFQTQLMELERSQEAAERNLRVAQEMLDHSEDLFRQGFVTALEVEGNDFTVTQAQLELDVVNTEIMVLNDYTREMEMATLEGNLSAAESKLAADQAGLEMELKRKAQAEVELEACTIFAERSGIVIYPSAAEWKSEPDITEGATVRKDQVLLLMPDMTQMQVKVGVHESIVERVAPGLKAIVTLPDRELKLEAEVTSVASITRPAGWWTGNIVKYDTIIQLPSVEDLKPGMSAEVEIVIARHEDVLTIPVSTVLETTEGDFCWIETAGGPQRRALRLGDSNDVHIIVEDGLQEGDEVVLNPIAFIEEARIESLSTLEETEEKPLIPDEPNIQP
jgi:HlyD family secretion protein